MTHQRVVPLKLALLVMCLLTALPALAQQSAPITQDAVNAVAARMFCPECENVPLDKCMTPVCQQWKDEIAAQLAAGRTSDEIVADFVARFGEHVVDVPQDAFLRTLTLAAPPLLVLLCLAFALMTLSRWRQRPSQTTIAVTPAASEADDSYRSRIERDLQRG